MKKIMTVNDLAAFLAGDGQTQWYVIFVGPEGSGKTTVAKAMKQFHGFKRLSQDKLVKKQPILRDYPHELWLQYMRKMRNRLRNHRNCVDDNKSSTPEERARIMKVVKKYHLAHAIIVHFDTPLETCQKWNASRKYPAGKLVVELNYNSFTPPTAEEGRLIRLRPVGDWKFEVIEVT